MKKMRYILLIFIPVFAGIFPAMGNTYYFSSINGNDGYSIVEAQQQLTPWRSLGKLNQVFAQLRPGDSVLFKRGEIFYGSLVATRSGTAGSPIVFAAYGKGDDPVISGFQRLAGWKSIGGSIWQAACPGCGPRVNMVVIHDRVQPMGRYPHDGYLKIVSHTAHTSITGDNLSGGPDWTGADLVMRKNRFILDRSIIVSQQGNTLSYKGGTGYSPTDKFGYFIQNDIKTLNRDGDWYYDPGAHVMNMYFSGSPQPEVMAASFDTLVNISGKAYLVFSGLDFSGSNDNGFFLSGAAHITISFCRIFFSGLDAIYSVQSADLTIDHVIIDHSNDDGINLTGSGGSRVTNCTIRNSGTLPGMGRGENSYIGIRLDGGNNTVQYNTIDTTGYSGIFFFHSNANIIKNNTVDYFCFMEDDGGGIYTWSGDIDSTVRRDAGIVTGNIILHGIASAAGTDSTQMPIAIGIYLDENSSGMEVSDNTAAYCTNGVFLQDAHEVTVKGNTFYGNDVQIALRHALGKGTLRNNEITGNKAVAVKSGQFVLVLSSGVTSGVDGHLAAFANIHDNQYSTAAGGALYKTVIRQNNQNMNDKGTLSDWQSKYGTDAHSVQAAPAAAVRLEYNSTEKEKQVDLNGVYKDLSGLVFKGQLQLAPYHSVVLTPQ
jgi:parallel beta-helix repeat protein